MCLSVCLVCLSVSFSCEGDMIRQCVCVCVCVCVSVLQCVSCMSVSVCLSVVLSVCLSVFLWYLFMFQSVFFSFRSMFVWLLSGHFYSVVIRCTLNVVLIITELFQH